MAGCSSDDQQSEICSKWPAFISNFLAIWVREILDKGQCSDIAAHTRASKTTPFTSVTDASAVMASGIGSTSDVTVGTFEFVSNGISAKPSCAIAWSSNGTRSAGSNEALVGRTQAVGQRVIPFDPDKFYHCPSGMIHPALLRKNR
jgi:hypothetical protein